ncbi:MAG TPA: AAA family ATPase, partial [Pirellulales bacterium]|nr:AAA family ATPase [Pirellulales bacterium]
MLPTLIEALCDPRRYDPPPPSVELAETHISWVLLAGAYAYKIKKPVNLGFLDFSTLAQREYFCREELRLNQRCAAELYLDVLTIGGTPTSPVWGATPAIEYAVKMRRFAAEDRLDAVAERGEFTAELCDGLAGELADFHARVDRAAPGSRFGSADEVCREATENFAVLRRSNIAYKPLEQLESWSNEQFARSKQRFDDRKRDGFVRECHGDLHLANMVRWRNQVLLYDSIEFSPALRWIDTASDLAFVVMDLASRGQHHASRRLLSAYLERSADYGALQVLRFYLVYRSLVRAKVAWLRAAQQAGDDAPQHGACHDCEHYLATALSFVAPPPARLILMHGVSGSGKTGIALGMVEQLGAVRLRSDLERKRLAGLGPLERTSKATLLYSEEMTNATYEHLTKLTAEILATGWSVVVDAACLRFEQRAQFMALAQRLG